MLIFQLFTSFDLFTFCLYVTLRFLIHQRLTDKNISKTRFSQHNRAHSQKKVIHKGG